MPRLLVTIVTLAWALWFGSLFTLFVVVSSLFKTFAADPETAGKAASAIFQRFEYLQLGLAAAALLGTFTWRIIAPRGRITLLFALFALSAVAQCYVAIRVNPELERMRVDHLTHSARFKRLHGVSMMTCAAEAALLLLGGLALSTRGEDQPTAD